jgi:serine/threonine kinase 32
VSTSPGVQSSPEAVTNAMNIRYLVVDLMNGGDLRFHISRKTFTEEAVRFWIAELGCALRYIHKQGIIHRDVKPDNVLLDSEGHIHLADFVSTVSSIEENRR